MLKRGSQGWAISRIGRHRELFYNAVENGLRRYKALAATDKVDLTARCRADYINSMVLAEAKKQFQTVGGSSFYPINNTTYHFINDCVVWYKKLDEEGLTSNFPTPSAEEMSQGSFSFAPQKVLIVLGFQFDELFQDIKAVSLIRFGSRKHVIFSIELEKLRPNVLPMTASDQAKAPKKPRVVLRRGPEQVELEALEQKQSS